MLFKWKEGIKNQFIIDSYNFLRYLYTLRPSFFFFGEQSWSKISTVINLQVFFFFFSVLSIVQKIGICGIAYTKMWNRVCRNSYISIKIFFWKKFFTFFHLLNQISSKNFFFFSFLFLFLFLLFSSFLFFFSYRYNSGVLVFTTSVKQ